MVRYILIEVNDSTGEIECDKESLEKCCINTLWFLSFLGLLALLLPWSFIFISSSVTKDDFANGNITLYDSFTNSNEGTTIEEEFIKIKIISIISTVLGTIVFLLIVPFCFTCCCEGFIGSKPHTIIIIITNACFIVWELILYLLLVLLDNKLEDVSIFSHDIDIMRLLSMISAILALFLYFLIYKITTNFSESE